MEKVEYTVGHVNGICSCGDKLHGAPGCETGPILAVPLNLHLPPLGHCGLNLDVLMYFVIKQLPYDICAVLRK